MAVTNLSHPSAASHMDVDYLSSLSADAIPALLVAFNESPEAQVRSKVRSVLERIRARLERDGSLEWQSFNFSRSSAKPPALCRLPTVGVDFSSVRGEASLIMWGSGP